MLASLKYMLKTYKVKSRYSSLGFAGRSGGCCDVVTTYKKAVFDDSPSHLLGFFLGCGSKEVSECFICVFCQSIRLLSNKFAGSLVVCDCCRLFAGGGETSVWLVLARFLILRCSVIFAPQNSDEHRDRPKS